MVDLRVVSVLNASYVDDNASVSVVSSWEYVIFS